jgi:membrane-associated phospholipid phosphatase
MDRTVERIGDTNIFIRNRWGSRIFSVNVDMKSRSAAFLFPAVIAVCIISYQFFDIPIMRFFEAHLDITRATFEPITRFGKSTPYLFASALAFVWFRLIQKRPILANAAGFIFLAVALSGVANELIKCLVGRSRPKLLLTQQVYGFNHFAFQYSYNSFPSGHANTAAALFYSLYLISNQYWYIYIPAALAIIVSRVVLCSHFFSDVIFGVYLALIVTSLLSIAFEKKGLQVRNLSAFAGGPSPKENS